MSVEVFGNNGDIDNVYAGTTIDPEGVRTAGGLYIGPVGTPLPVSAADELDDGFTFAGFVNEDGYTRNENKSTKDIKAWGGNVIIKLLDDYTLEYTVKLYEVRNQLVNSFIYGDANVIVSNADNLHGTGQKIRHRAVLPGRWSVVFKSFHDEATAMDVVSLAQVTKVDNVKIVHNDLMSYDITITAYADKNGDYGYTLFDDGKTVDGGETTAKKTTSNINNAPLTTTNAGVGKKTGSSTTSTPPATTSSGS